MPSDIIKKLNWRYATKKFDPKKKIAKKDFDILLETLRLTPSSFGLQPWKFVVVKSANIRKKLRPHAWDQSQITDASHLLIICSLKEMNDNFLDKVYSERAKLLHLDKARTASSKERFLNFFNAKPEHERQAWLKRQCYVALGNLLTVAALLKIDACPIEGMDDPKEFDKILKLDKYGVQTVVICALGYRSKDDKHAKDPKFRLQKSKLFVEI